MINATVPSLTGRPEIDALAEKPKSSVLIVAEDLDLIRLLKGEVMAAGFFPWTTSGAYGNIQVVAQNETARIACIVVEYEYVERHQSLACLMAALPADVPVYCLHDYVDGRILSPLVENLHVSESERLAFHLGEVRNHLTVESAKACQDDEAGQYDLAALRQHAQGCSFCQRLLGLAPRAAHFSEQELADYRSDAIGNAKRRQRLEGHLTVCRRCSDALLAAG